MKTVPLQLVLVGLGNGKKGVFVGGPLVPDEGSDDENHVDDVWFSNIQQVPEGLTLEMLFDLVRDQILSQTHPTLQ